MLKSAPSADTANASSKAEDEFVHLFGPSAGPAIKTMMVRVGTLSEAEVGTLAARWRPSMAFLAAQATAWKIARKTHMNGPVDFAYNAVYASMPHSHPEWAAAANVAAHAALGVALGPRLRPEMAALLTAPWDETIVPLPEPTQTPVKVRVRKRVAVEDQS